MKAIRVRAPGGPDKLQLEDVETPAPGRGEALVRLEAVGVNFIDVYHRSGLYPLPLPFTPGSEGAGVVVSVGEDVSEVKPNDRVAYAMNLGAYAELAIAPAWKLVPLPSSVDAKVGAAAMLQGMTAHFLSRSVKELRRGDTALVHAAAGGVGLLLVQLLKQLGVGVIGTVSTDEKAKLAKAAGADELILYTQKDFASETKALTGGKGVDVVFDSVGKDTFDKSLSALKPRGMLVLFGQSSGPVPPVEISALQKNALFLTRPALHHYAHTREELLQRAGDVFDWIAAGKLKLHVEREYPLADARRAHEDLEGRKTTGKLLLIP